MYYEDYEDYQDSFRTYKEWKVKELIVPYNYDDPYGTNISSYRWRHLKRKWSFLHGTVGPYRNWKRYRKFQYKS